MQLQCNFIDYLINIPRNSSLNAAVNILLDTYGTCNLLSKQISENDWIDQISSQTVKAFCKLIHKKEQMNRYRRANKSAMFKWRTIINTLVFYHTEKETREWCDVIVHDWFFSNSFLFVIVGLQETFVYCFCMNDLVRFY